MLTMSDPISRTRTLRSWFALLMVVAMAMVVLPVTGSGLVSAQEPRPKKPVRRLVMPPVRGCCTGRGSSS